MFDLLCVVCVEVTIRSVFGGLGGYEGVLNTETRHLYAYTHCYMYSAARQERMIKKCRGRACNFTGFRHGQNNPPVLFLEHTQLTHTYCGFETIHARTSYGFLQTEVAIFSTLHIFRPFLQASMGVTRSSSALFYHVLLITCISQCTSTSSVSSSCIFYSTS